MNYSNDDVHIGERYEFAPENQQKLEDIAKLLETTRDAERPAVSVWSSLFRRTFNNHSDESDEVVTVVKDRENAVDDNYNPTQLLNYDEDEISGPMEISEEEVSGTKVDDAPTSVPAVVQTLKRILELEVLHNVPIPVELFQDFIRISANDLRSSLADMKTENISEGAFTRLCSSVIELDQQLSLIWCVSFVESFILSRVTSRKQHVPSRAVMMTISNFAKKYPRAVIDGFMIPCITNCDCGGIQIDTVRQLFTDNLSQEHQDMFLKRFLEESFPWSEAVVVFVKHCIDTRSQLVINEIFDLFIMRLSDCSINLDNNLLFSKWLSAILTKFRSKLNGNHTASLTVVVDRNKTFLKKGFLEKLHKIK